MQSNKTERFLKKEGAEYRLKTIDISDVDLPASELNQARLAEPIIEELIERYTLALGNGDEFTPIIVYKITKYVIIDGNHRLRAYIRAGKSRIKVYLVTNSYPALISKLTRIANRKLNGEGQSDNDVIAQAKWFHRTQDMTISEVAAEWDIKPGRLSDALRFESGNLRLSRHGIDYTKLSKTAVLRLSSIDDDSVMSELAHLAIDAKLTSIEITDIITAMKTKRSEKERAKVIKNFRERPEILTRNRTGTGNSKNRKAARRTARRTRFFRNMTSLYRFLEKKDTAGSLRIANQHDVERVTKMRDDIIAGLDRLLSEAQL